MATDDQIVREPERRKMMGTSRATQWRMERKGLAPRRVPISENAVGWLKSEILQWMQRKANARQR
jgi:predicted DNA-binding transcriptional regulator AlpA